MKRVMIKSGWYAGLKGIVDGMIGKDYIIKLFPASKMIVHSKNLTEGTYKTDRPLISGSELEEL